MLEKRREESKVERSDGDGYEIVGFFIHSTD